MALHKTAQAIVNGDPDQLFAMADVIDRHASSASELAGSGRAHAVRSAGYWRSAAGASFRTRIDAHAAALDSLVGPLNRGATAYRELAGGLGAARRRAQAALDASVALGLNAGDLVGNPSGVAAFAAVNPQKIPQLARLIGEVVGARHDADGHRDLFVAQMGGMNTDANDRRNPDGAGGDRKRADRVWRREEGGEGNNSDLDYDWAGGAILERYLRGGGDGLSRMTLTGRLT